VILTKPAASDISFIHDRMPVILSKDMQEEWISKQMDIQDVMNHSIENVMYQEL
jgi:putative SOS response-associated peptidase YedK